MKLNEIEKLKQTDKFYEWWDAVGSAIRPREGQDMQEHSLRVARMAWQDRGLLIENTEDRHVAQQSQPTKENQ
jgi:hypothetical protein